MGTWFRVLALVSAASVGELGTAGCDDSGGTDTPDDGGVADGSDATSDAGRDGATGTDAGNDSGGEDAAVPDPNDWSCIGSVVDDTPATEEATVSAVLLNLLDGSPAVGLTVKVCDRDDLLCEPGILTDTTSASGEISGSLPLGDKGFFGYFDISGTGYPTHLYFTTRYMTEAPPAAVQMFVINDAIRSTIAALVGVPLDDERGLVALVALDCEDGFAHGVTVEASTSDLDSETVYLVGGMPARSDEGTDESGFAGFINLPAGEVTITATVADTGDVIGTTTVFVRADAITVFTLGPTPLDPVG